MSTEVQEQVMQDIAERLAAIGEAVSEERIRGIVQGYLDDVLANPGHELSRKMRFGGGERKLAGSKFARWGLNVADVEFLHDLMEAGQRAGMNRSGPSEELRSAFADISEAVYLPEDEVRRIDQRAIDNAFPRIPAAWLTGTDRELQARGQWWRTQAYAAAQRAMDTAESGYGAQLIGAQYVGDLWEGARSDSRVFNLLNTFEMTDPTAYLPVEADLPEMLWVSESAANNSSAYATVKSGSNRVAVSAKKFVIHQMWSGEMEEDSIIPFVPFLRRQAMLALAHYADSLVLNGDTTNAATGNINLDDADPADTKHYLAVDGIRHVGLVDNTGNQKDCASGLTYDELKYAQSRMIDRTYLMDWGHPTRPEDLVYVAEPATADKIAMLDEVVTVDKFGASATVLTGQVARIGQHPLISSIAMPLTEADGKVSNTGANNTKGQVVVFNRRGLVVGWRRRVKLETERIPASDQWRMVYSLRLGLGRFSPTGAASGIEWADVLYNITL